MYCEFFTALSSCNKIKFNKTNSSLLRALSFVIVLNNSLTMSNIENSIPLPNSRSFRDYCLNNESYAQSLLDRLLNSQQSFPNIITKHLSTLKSYITGGQSFEEYSNQSSSFIVYRIVSIFLSVRQYDNSVLCGHVWINATISYRCRTCATIPCMRYSLSLSIIHLT